jgi:hypothetical protein
MKDWNKEIAHARNINDLKDRYRYIYDAVCTYLDQEFKSKNICGFKNNKCLSVQNHSSYICDYGCCKGPTRGLCPHFKNGTCSIKALSCKLFTCRYLHRQGIKYQAKDIPLLKEFFNHAQLRLLDDSIFIDEDELLKKLYHRRFF